MSALRGFRKVVACMGKRSRNEVNLKNAHVPRLVHGIQNIRQSWISRETQAMKIGLKLTPLSVHGHADLLFL